MVAVGIDVSKGKSKVAVVGEGKKVLQKPFDVIHSKSEMSKFVDFLRQYGDEVHAVMEHTGVYYKVVAEALHKADICVSAVTFFGNTTIGLYHECRIGQRWRATRAAHGFALNRRALLFGFFRWFDNYCYFFAYDFGDLFGLGKQMR